MSHGALGTTAWGDLPVKYTTDKIPPGWHVGCGWEYRKYKDMCGEWKVLSEVMTDKQRVVALRFRLKGVAHDTAMAATRPPPGTEAAPTDDSEYWRLHWAAMDSAYMEDIQLWNMKLFDQFFEYSRKQGLNVRDFIAESSLKYSEAKQAGLTLDPTARSYWLLKSARFNDEQKRWVLTPVQNDLTKFDDIEKSALKMPEAMAKHIHLASVGDDDYDESATEGEVYHLGDFMDEDNYSEDEWSEFLAYWHEQAEVWFADGEDQNDAAWPEADWSGEGVYWADEQDEHQDADLPEEFSVFMTNADEADTEDDEKACGVFMQHRKNKRTFSKRGGKGGYSKHFGGKGRVSGFRRGGFKGGKNRPGGWLQKGSGKSFGKNKSFGGYGKGKPPPWSNGFKGKFGKKGKGKKGKGGGNWQDGQNQKGGPPRPAFQKRRW